MKYLNWNEITVTDFSPNSVNEMYKKGYVFTRLGRGVMQQTRSVRIDLKRFALSSENRRILKKIPDVLLYLSKVPLADYSYPLGKLAKDFYDTKFGPGIMSAQKIKEMLTDPANSNFNCLLKFEDADTSVIPAPASAGVNSSLVIPAKAGIQVIDVGKLDPSLRPSRSLRTCWDDSSGYAICYENESLLHYSYPFYDLKGSPKDMGLGMMIKAIEWAKAEDKSYTYLGSLQRPSDTYKLQFEGLEWFDGGQNGSGTWKTDFEEVKKILASAKM